MENPYDPHGVPSVPEPPPTGIMPPRSLFADDGPMPLPPAVKPPTLARPKFNVVTRVGIPSAILIAGIACIAWVAQYLPSRGRTLPAPASGEVHNLITFASLQSQWDANDKDYIPEFELGTGGHYDFEFSNTSDTDAELGVAATTCVCSGIQVCVFQNTQQRDEHRKGKEPAGLTWTDVKTDPTWQKSVVIPSQATGVLRLGWKGTQTVPEQLRLEATVWNRPAAIRRNNSFQKLTVLVSYVQPAIFDRDKIDLGSPGPSDGSTASFLCWSATRELDVKPASEDKRLQIETRPLTPQELKALSEQLRKSGKRVRSAWKVTLTLFEEKDGKQLDMGLLLKPVPLSITSNAQPVVVKMPDYRANIRGDVFLGPQEEGGRIEFKGTATRKVTLFAPKGAKLSFEKCDPSQLDMKVELTPKDDTRTRWEMVVTAKPEPGLFPEDSVLVLRCELPAQGNAPAVTRLYRIPVVGRAGSH
jgi:hypothetical protein